MGKNEMTELGSVVILGAEYTVYEDPTVTESDEADGIASVYEKTIRINPPANMLKDTNNEYAKQKRYAEVLRHEIIHAFLFESGLPEYCYNEQLVDWIATQFGKLKAACDTAEKFLTP